MFDGKGNEETRKKRKNHGAAIVGDPKKGKIARVKGETKRLRPNGFWGQPDSNSGPLPSKRGDHQGAALGLDSSRGKKGGECGNVWKKGVGYRWW